MNNKLLIGLAAVFLVSLVSFGVVAYQGNANVKGPNYNEDVHEQLEVAIDAGDYDAWLKIRQDNNLPTKGRMFQVINKDNFAKFQQMHEANLAGDTATAQTIRTELGLGQGMMQGKGNQAQKGQGSMQGGMRTSQSGQRMQQYADADGDGACDNYASRN